jgi:hypothetical protein
MTLSAGRLLGVSELSELLGAGGAGEVYRARDTRPGRDVRFLPGYSEGNFDFEDPSWSPDAKRVYFSVSRKSGDVDLLEGY